MPSFDAAQPHLRLISEPSARLEEWARHGAARGAIARENISAVAPGRLDPRDPRWVLAVRAHAQLQGTMMTPERRERVLKTARQLGMRAFDANLIIAIVQDQARRGGQLGDAQPMLTMIAPPPIAPARGAWTRWLGAAMLAALANVILIWWLLSL